MSIGDHSRLGSASRAASAQAIEQPSGNLPGATGIAGMPVRQVAPRPAPSIEILGGITIRSRPFAELVSPTRILNDFREMVRSFLQNLTDRIATLRNPPNPAIQARRDAAATHIARQVDNQRLDDFIKPEERAASMQLEFQAFAPAEVINILMEARENPDLAKFLSTFEYNPDNTWTVESFIANGIERGGNMP